MSLAKLKERSSLGDDELTRRESVMLTEENVPNERLRRTRHLKGWTQSDLADAVGTDFETVSRWERGITMPSAYFREQLCAASWRKPLKNLGFDPTEPQ